jgi:O-antigen/teichoic acid export membrane protein
MPAPASLNGVPLCTGWIPNTLMTEAEHTEALLRKTAGGAGWTIAWRAATRALGVLSTFVLAHILVPADFGLIALATSFSGAIDTFSEVGMKEALVRSTLSSREAYDTAFTLSLIRGVITSAILAASAEMVARIFGDPRLFLIILILAVMLLVNCLENVGVADFRRDLNFHREFQLFILPRFAQVVVTIVLAITLANYWALVAGLVTSRVLQTIASYAMHPYRPRLSLKEWRDFVSFSIWTWLLSLAEIIKDRCVIMVIGGMLNPAKLGLYSLGLEIAVLPENEFVLPLCRASFAGFAAARRGGLSVSETFLRIAAWSFVIVLPAGIGISAIAAPLVYLVFGPRWLAAVPVVQILAAAGAFIGVSRITMSLFNAFAYFSALFWGLIIISLVQIAILFPLVNYAGITGAAWAGAIATLAQSVVFTVLAIRRLKIRSWDILSRIWRCLVASGVMVLALVLSALSWAENAPTVAENIRMLLLTSLTGAAIYSATLLSLWVASGRPTGPEQDIFSIVRQGGARAYHFVGRAAALLRLAVSR